MDPAGLAPGHLLETEFLTSLRKPNLLSSSIIKATSIVKLLETEFLTVFNKLGNRQPTN
jgi:hypothetical protein